VFVLYIPETATLAVCANRNELARPMQEIAVRSFSLTLSEVSLQPYDVNQKLHTVKLQHVQ
jgi:hypothetical protein